MKALFDEIEAEQCVEEENSELGSTTDKLCRYAPVIVTWVTPPPPPTLGPMLGDLTPLIGLWLFYLAIDGHLTRKRRIEIGKIKQRCLPVQVLARRL